MTHTSQTTSPGDMGLRANSSSPATEDCVIRELLSQNHIRVDPGLIEAERILENGPASSALIKALVEVNYFNADSNYIWIGGYRAFHSCGIAALRLLCQIGAPIIPEIETQFRASDPVRKLGAALILEAMSESGAFDKLSQSLKDTVRDLVVSNQQVFRAMPFLEKTYDRLVTPGV